VIVVRVRDQSHVTLSQATCAYGEVKRNSPHQRLIVELDGGYHAQQEERDITRTAYLTEQGYRMLRFWNEQVNRAIDNVLEAIFAALADS
jgi:very-short-patch-repair endonuclease